MVLGGGGGRRCMRWGGGGGGTELGRKFMSLLSNLVQVSDVPHVPGSSSLLEGGESVVYLRHKGPALDGSWQSIAAALMAAV